MSRRRVERLSLTLGLAMVAGLCLSSSLVTSHPGTVIGMPRLYLSGLLTGATLVALAAALFILVSSRLRRDGARSGNEVR